MARCLCGVLALVLGGSVAMAADITRDQVTNLVNAGAAAVVKDAAGSLAKITAGEAPFREAALEEFYTFVYDTNVVIVAHPDTNLVGRSYRGKPDAKGKKFRDEIVEGALKQGTGWIDYMYKKPNQEGLFPKETYFKLVTGSDGKSYVVCAGRYLPKEK